MRVQAVCADNSLRSAMTAVVLADLVSRSSIASLAEVSSAGLLVMGPGAPMDGDARQALADVGLDGSAHQSTQFEMDDFPELDLVLFMESRHLELVASAGPPRGWRERSRLLRTFDPVACALQETELADPTGRGYDAVRRCLKDIRAAAPRVVAALERASSGEPL